MATINYAKSYSRELDQAFPYVLNFGALYATPNNGRYRWVNSKTIEIPTISTTGRTNADRDTIGQAKRNYDNSWKPLTLTNERMWETLVHPMDIDQTNMVASIGNITKVYNEEQKFPEMDAYTISKIYTDWEAASMQADTTEITADNILEIFDKMMLNMDNARVPAAGRLLYVTHEINTILKKAKELVRQLDVKSSNSSIYRAVTSLDTVKIIPVPKDLMLTAYDFTTGWKKGSGAKQIHMCLIHPLAVITPVSYQFAELEEPSAHTHGKYYYYEESFEDVFILANKKNAIQFVTAASPVV